MGHDEECREKTYDVQAGDRQFSLRAIHRRDPSPVKWGLGGHFDVNVMPGLSPLFWMSRSVPFTDVSVLDENRIAPRYASNYSIDVREVWHTVPVRIAQRPTSGSSVTLTVP